MVFHTEALAGLDGERPVRPYAAGPALGEQSDIWMPLNAEHQWQVQELRGYMLSHGRDDLPGVLLREPEASRSNQVAVAVGGVRVGRLADEEAAAVAPGVVQLKEHGWLAVARVRFVVRQDDNGDRIGCVVELPDVRCLADELCR